MTAEKIIPCAIERFERVLISYAKEITGDIESARDAVQETFLRLSRQDLVTIETPARRKTASGFFVRLIRMSPCVRHFCRKILRFLDAQGTRKRTHI